SRSQANINHKYAMLPLVFQTANSVGYTNFVDGLVPDIEQAEDYSNLGILGDVNEPLLATAIADITGIPMPAPRRINELEIISESNANLPHYQVMYIEKK
ncbi:MAG TPA: peptidase S41, partial [Flavobacteriaceae bacterium]|nr:peptidase S41 [Flavobacteriaceae bacterium]